MNDWQQIIKSVWEALHPKELVMLRQIPTIKLPEPDPNVIYCIWNALHEIYPIRCPRHGVYHRGKP